MSLSSAGVAALGISLVVGFIAAWFGARRFCRSTNESASALMTYATCWFTGIYSPIAAIWANAPFYAWAVEQKAKPASDALGVRLVPVIEKWAIAYFLGAGALFVAGYLVMRWCRAVENSGPEAPPSRLDWNLDRIDVACGVVALVTGLSMAIVGPGPKLTHPMQVVGCVCAAFLLCLLFRSLRLQRLALRSRVAIADERILTKKAGTLCVAILGLCLGVVWLLIDRYEIFDEWTLLLITLILLIPWLAFRKASGCAFTAVTDRLHPMNRFAVRCGVYSWLGCSLMVSGRVLTGIAESEISKAGDLPTPFALTVIAMKPIFCISVLPALSAWIGTFVIAWALPRQARASERVLSCAQAGAIGMVASYVSLLLFALTLAICTVPSLGAAAQIQQSPQFHQRFADGGWRMLSRLYLSALGAMTAGGAALWAAEATVECGWDWLVDWITRKRRAAAKRAASTAR